MSTKDSVQPAEPPSLVGLHCNEFLQFSTTKSTEFFRGIHFRDSSRKAKLFRVVMYLAQKATWKCIIDERGTTSINRREKTHVSALLDFIMQCCPGEPELACLTYTF